MLVPGQCAPPGRRNFLAWDGFERQSSQNKGLRAPFQYLTLAQGRRSMPPPAVRGHRDVCMGPAADREMTWRLSGKVRG